MLRTGSPIVTAENDIRAGRIGLVSQLAEGGMRWRIVISILVAAVLCPAMAWVQEYPTKIIKIVVPFPAGGPADLFARILATGLTAELGHQTVLEHRPGGAGLSGVDAVAKSSPDGHTIGITGSAALSTIPFMVSKMPFNWQVDLALLTLVVRVPEVLVVHPSISTTTLQEFVAHARANPRKISYGSAGTGSITHLAVELLKAEAKIDLVHVPYRGAAPAINDLLGGHIQLVVLDLPVLLPHIRSGSVKAIAVTSLSRSSALPEVPTTSEAGFESVLSDNWYGLIAPSGTPRSILDKLHKAALSVLRSPDLKKQFEDQNAIPSPMTPEQFTSFLMAEQAKWGPVIKITGAKIE